MPPRRTWSLSEPSCSIALLNRSVICPCSLMRSWSRVALTDSLVNTSAYTAANAEMAAMAMVARWVQSRFDQAVRAAFQPRPSGADRNGPVWVRRRHTSVASPTTAPVTISTVGPRWGAIAVVTGGHHHGDAAHNIPLRIAARPAAITIDHTPVMCHVRFLSLGSRWREGASLIGTPDPTGPRHRTAPR